MSDNAIGVFVGDPSPTFNQVTDFADQSNPAASSLVGRLATPRYHQQLRNHFETGEPELWSWFAETATSSSDSIDEAELELLKTAYRLDGSMHDVLTGFALLIAGRLDLTGTVTLYQELGTRERNARVLLLGEDIHVVFGGDVLELLDLGEQLAVLAHELAHVSLWQREDKAYWILDTLIHRLAADPSATEAVDETARRLRLHTEVFADAVASALVDDDNDVISSIVKVHSGLRTVDPEAYLRQAQQILEADPTSSRAWTHPELHVRVACLAALRAAEPDSIVARLIEGPDELDRVDLLGQLRLQELTGRVLGAGRRVASSTAAQTGIELDEIDAYLNSFPLAVLDAARADAEPFADAAFEADEPSIRHLCAALLVDLALVPDGIATDLAALAPLAIEAERLGVASEFDKVVCRATSRTARDLRLLRKAGSSGQ